MYLNNLTWPVPLARYPIPGLHLETKNNFQVERGLSRVHVDQSICKGGHDASKDYSNAVMEMTFKGR